MTQSVDEVVTESVETSGAVDATEVQESVEETIVQAPVQEPVQEAIVDEVTEVTGEQPPAPEVEH